MPKLQEGKPAPDFSLPASTGKDISLSGLKGSNVVLYFYPKDSTPGCTQEACDFRDSIGPIKKAGAVVLGVSADSLNSHKKFSEKYKLPFPLLSDEEKGMLKEYGVWQKKSFMGKEFMGIVRTTVIIDKKGNVHKIFPQVKVAGHRDEVLEVLKLL